MVKLEHDGTQMFMEAHGVFEEMLAELTEVNVAFLESVSEQYFVDKSQLFEDFARAISLFKDMENLYREEEIMV